MLSGNSEQNRRHAAYPRGLASPSTNPRGADRADSSGSSDTHTSMENLCCQRVCAGQAALCWGWRCCDPALPRSYGLGTGIRATSTLLCPRHCCLSAVVLELQRSWRAKYTPGLFYFYFYTLLLCILRSLCFVILLIHVRKISARKNVRAIGMTVLFLLNSWCLGTFGGLFLLCFGFGLVIADLSLLSPGCVPAIGPFFFQLMEIFCNDIF